jgi:hypothetical protein
MPYFIKIDIEGHDVYVLRSLCKLGKRPAYLSIENSGIHCLIELYNTGARRFKFINQKEMWRIKLPNPPLEGNYVDAKFHACTSGPFGKELPGDWIGIEDAMQFFLSFVYNPPEGFFGAWWDIHVQYDQA